MLSQYKCMVIGHEEQQIIGICENVSCSQQYRRVCFDCQEMHQHNDKLFKMSDIKNDKGIQKILEEFKEDSKMMINNIQIQCHIQQYFLSLKLIEFMEQHILKYSQLFNIIHDLDLYKTEQWDQINVANYLQNDDNIGIYNYIQPFQDKLQIIDQTKDIYIMNIKDTIMNNDLQQQGNDKQMDNLIQLIPVLQQKKDNIFKLIIENDIYRLKEQEQYPILSLYDIIHKQDQKLNTKTLQSQFNEIKYLI